MVNLSLRFSGRTPEQTLFVCSALIHIRRNAHASHFCPSGVRIGSRPHLVDPNFLGYQFRPLRAISLFFLRNVSVRAAESSTHVLDFRSNWHILSILDGMVQIIY